MNKKKIIALILVSAIAVTNITTSANVANNEKSKALFETNVLSVNNTSNNAVVKEANITEGKIAVNSIEVLGNKEAGEQQTIFITDASGQGTIKYKYEVYNTKQGWKVVSDYTEETSVTWTPDIVSKYTVRVTAKDDTNKTAIKDISYEAVNTRLTLTGFSTADNEEIKAGNPVTLIPEGTKTDSTKYKLEVYNTRQGWKVISDFTTNPLEWTPEIIGNNLVRITAKDDTGKTVKYEKYVAVKDGALTLTGFKVSDNPQVGQDVIITPEGDITPTTQYIVEVYNTVQGWKKIREYSPSSGEISVKWNPEISGKNLIRVTAKDNTGKVIKSEKWVIVDIKEEEFKLTGINISDTVQLGTEVEIGIDGAIPEGAKVTYEVYNTANGWKSISSTWTPDRTGQNLVRVTATYAGKTLRLDKWVTVNNDAFNLEGINISDTVQSGKEVEIGVNGSIPEGAKLTYEIYNTVNGWETLNSSSWTPNRVGQNLVRVTASHAGKTLRVDKWVTVNNDALNISDVLIVGDIRIGKTVTIAPQGSFTESTYYTYQVYNTRVGWVILGSDSWSPEVIGDTLVRVIAQDDTGKVVTFDKWVKVLDEVVNPDEVYRGDLIYAIDYANEQSLLGVVPAVANEFNAALQEAIRVNGDLTSSQKTVNAAFNRLANAIHMLEFRVGDKTNLNASILTAEGLNSADYTEESWSKLVNALNNAQNVSADENAMQAEVDEANTWLTNAITSLVTIQ